MHLKLPGDPLIGFSIIARFKHVLSDVSMLHEFSWNGLVELRL